MSALFRNEGARLVTLTGPGGTGKTRLSLAVAEALEPELREGAVFVGLAPVSDPDLLVPTIAEALDVREGSRSLADGVVEHLRERRMLLVLDNFEQLLPAAAAFVGELLAAAPRLWVLATSRAPLRLAAEQEYPVPPFDTPDAGLEFEKLVTTDALRLFAARARAVDPGFELDEASAPEIARVCARLDGLPLAIELAAARSKLLAPGELLQRLEREPNLLPPGPRDAPARQRTLAATVHWSYDLLAPGERLTFARLGVFVGGCTLEAAEEVCDVPLDSLATLVDNNLLRRRESRFTMLETVRHFAVERLEEGGSTEVRRRHAEWLARLAETMAEKTFEGEDVKTWLDRIQPEHDNIRAALAWSLEAEPEIALRMASSLRLFWEVRGHFSEGSRWLEAAMPHAAEAPPRLRLTALSSSGAVAFRVGDHQLSHARFSAALELARELDDELWIARLLSDVGTVAAVREEWDTASVMLEESADLFRKLDVPSRLGTVLTNLGHIAGQRGDYARAIEVTEEALSLESSHKQNAAISTYNLGSHNLSAGNLGEAQDWLERAVALALELGFKEVMAYSLAAHARLCLLEGDAVRAALLAGIADRLLEEAGILLQPSEQAVFEEAKETARRELGDAYDDAHNAAMTGTIEEALRRGNVLAATA
ncbi:MAG TPA: tetratricopeptide repeat protein [Gaiellaceae bacterium]|nr:tetratricopeptide repeat protein [Gaiellaceae bacterium]